MNSLIVLIPAYNPPKELISLCNDLSKHPFKRIVVVNDGSEKEYNDLFFQLETMPNVKVLSHVINQGKWDAIKTGINYILFNFEGCAVITAEATLKFDIDEILALCDYVSGNFDRVFLGSHYDRSEDSFLLRLWKRSECFAFRLITGKKLFDLRTNLKLLPASLLENILLIKSSDISFDFLLLLSAVNTNTKIKNFRIKKKDKKGQVRSGIFKRFSTDWSQYYKSTSPLSRVTRKITTSLIIRSIRKTNLDFENSDIAEFGGGNSCVYPKIKKKLGYNSYHVFDNNERGLKLFARKSLDDARASNFKKDLLLDDKIERKYDISISIGLIEHFEKQQTKLMIKRHFDAVKDGGFVFVTFPKGTFIYRSIRFVAEQIGVWKFHDERPMDFNEVIAICSEYCELFHKYTNHWIFLTQGACLFKKKSLEDQPRTFVIPKNDIDEESRKGDPSPSFHSG
ncbi:MAG: glycosyltransferase [Candidatus Omnitrophica bacterium]|nr:glycosyltransferase [Candidatus Omnitrophota bacterium]